MIRPLDYYPCLKSKNLVRGNRVRREQECLGFGPASKVVTSWLIGLVRYS